MKKLLYVLLALVVLLAAAVLLGPGLIDWNDYKAEIAARIERATGRDVAIEGGINLSVLPGPAFSAAGVRLANVEGGSAPAMATARGLRVKVRFAPLLQGRIEVEQVVLMEPKVLLERLPDGTANWRLGRSDARSAVDGYLDQISLDSFRIVGGTIRYRDATTGYSERISAVNAEIAADSLSGPFDAEGRMTVRGVPISFQGGMGSLNRADGAVYNMSLRVPDTGARADVTGTLQPRADDGPALSGTAELRGDDLQRLLARIDLGRDLPPQLAQRFTASGKLRLDSDGLGVEGLELRLGEVSADGTARIAFGSPVSVTSKLRVQQVNLDRLLAMTEANGAAAAKTQGSENGAFTLPKAVRGELDLRVGALIYKGQVVRQARMSATLADGAVTLNQAMALLPGGSDLALSGSLDASPNGASFDGRVEAASDNLRAIFDWFDIDLQGVPAGRLRRMSLLADVAATPRLVTFTNLDIEVDTMTVTGGLAVAPRRRLGLGIGLSVDKLNLDAYLPREDTATAGSKTQDTGQSPWTAVLGGFDANLDLRAGTLIYNGKTAHDVHLDATLQKGDLTVRAARVGRIADSAIELSGILTGVSDLQPRIDTTVNIHTADPQKLAELVNARAAVPAGLGAMTLSGLVGGSPDKLSVDLALEALGGSLTAKGDVRPLAGPAAFDLQVGMKHPSLRELADRLPNGPALPQGLGGLDVSARLSGDLRGPRAQDLTGKIGSTRVGGAVDADLAGPRPRIRANLETGALPVRAFGLAAAGAGEGNGYGGGDSGAAEGAGRWSDTPVELDGLHGFDGEIALRAEALVLDDGVRLEGAVLDALLNEGVLDIERLSGTLFGGSVEVIGTADTRDGLTAGLDVTVERMESGTLLARGFETNGLSGPISLDASLNATGRSERALVKSLNGEGRVSGELTLKAGEDARRAGPLFGLLGEEASALQGVAETRDMLVNVFADKPATLEGHFEVADGTVRTGDTTLTGQGMRTVLAGQVDLPNWRLDARIDLIRADDAGDDPFMTALLRGPLDRPNPTIKGGPFQVRTPEASTEPDAEPEPQREPEPEPEAETQTQEAPETEEAPEPEARAAGAPDDAAPARKPEAKPARKPEAAPADAASAETASPDQAPDRETPADAAPKTGERKPSAEDIIRGLLENPPQDQE